MHPLTMVRCDMHLVRWLILVIEQLDNLFGGKVLEWRIYWVWVRYDIIGLFFRVAFWFWDNKTCINELLEGVCDP